MVNPKKAILKTLIYADIFDYPLLKSEIYHFLIAKKPIPKQTFNQALKDLLKLKKISQTSSHYYLKGKKSSLTIRRNRQQSSTKKIAYAKKIANLLKLIPSIKLVAITGALAMKNSDQDDDIDFMVITSTNRLWLTRLLVNSFLDLFFLRRRPNQTKYKNKFCVNLFLDESALIIHSTRQNLYTAHEVAQIMPLVNKNNAYEKFLNANNWILSFLPHTLNNTISIYPKTLTKTTPFFLENLAFSLQRLYMKRKLTRETVTKSTAFFHPRPTNQIILDQYKKKLKINNLK